MWHYDVLDDYIKYYSADRLHFSLEINNYEMQMMAFHKRKAVDEIRHQNPMDRGRSEVENVPLSHTLQIILQFLVY